MSKMGKGCPQVVKGTIALDQETIDAICECMADAQAAGIELGATPVGCIKDGAGVTTGSVFLCIVKGEDGVTQSTVVKAVNFADGSVIDPYTGVISPCDAPAAENIVPVALEELCANVDGNPQAVVPVIGWNTADGSFVLPVQYLNEFGLPITGTITPADPCDCPCVECPEDVVCVDVTMEGFDYYPLSVYTAGQNTGFTVAANGGIPVAMALDYTVESDGTGKASWYPQVLAAVNANAGWNMVLVTDVDEASKSRPVWNITYSGTGPADLVITENADTRTISVDAAGVVTATALDGINPFGTDPFTINPC